MFTVALATTVQKPQARDDNLRLRRVRAGACRGVMSATAVRMNFLKRVDEGRLVCSEEISQSPAD
jgi:hypothetical protein